MAIVDTGTQDGSNWATNEASIGIGPNDSCNILAELMPHGDNRSQFIQGCLYQYNREVNLANHPGLGS